MNVEFQYQRIIMKLPKSILVKLLAAFGKYSTETQTQYVVDGKTTEWLVRNLPHSLDDEVYYIDGNGWIVEEGEPYAIKLQFMWSNQHYWVSA